MLPFHSYRIHDWEAFGRVSVTLRDVSDFSLLYPSKYSESPYQPWQCYYTLFSEDCQGVCDTFGVLIWERLTIVRKRARTTILGDISRRIKYSTRFICTFNYFPCFPQFTHYPVEKVVENYTNCFSESNNNVTPFLFTCGRVSRHLSNSHWNIISKLLFDCLMR